MNNIRNICIAISLFIHTSFISVFGTESWLEKWLPVIPKPDSTEVALRFIDSPLQENLAEQDKDQKSKFISDKSVTAKDTDHVTPKVPEKTKVKEISKSKQLAKLTKELPKPFPDRERSKQPKKKIKPKDYIESKESREKPQQEEPKKEPKVTPSANKTIQAVAGRDTVNLPQVSEDLFSAYDKERISFEAQYHRIGPYFKEIKGIIETYWLGYLVFRYPNTAPVESETIVSFRVLPSGDVENVEVVEHSGDVLFRDFCVATVSNTAPYPPIPEDIEDLEEDGGLNIVFTFRYR